MVPPLTQRDKDTSLCAVGLGDTLCLLRVTLKLHQHRAGEPRQAGIKKRETPKGGVTHLGLDPEAASLLYWVKRKKGPGEVAS